jgi:hypothetical protein
MSVHLRFSEFFFSLSTRYSCRGRALSCRWGSTHVLHPLLKRLGIAKAGLHAFRHSRVTMLRKNGTPQAQLLSYQPLMVPISRSSIRAKFH